MRFMVDSLSKKNMDERRRRSHWRGKATRAERWLAMKAASEERESAMDEKGSQFSFKKKMRG